MSFDEKHLDSHYPCQRGVAELDALIRELVNEIQSVRNSEVKVSETRRLRICELEAAIVKFWDYAKLVLPMPVHPAVGEIMRIGRDLESRGDKQ